MTIRIDRDRALALLHEVVDPNPGFIYRPGEGMTPAGVPLSTCMYVRDGEPSCLVGQVLALAGVSLEDLAQMDAGSEIVPDSAFDVLYQNGGLPEDLYVTPDAASILARVQTLQDLGNGWGFSLQTAEKEN